MTEASTCSRSRNLVAWPNAAGRAGTGVALPGEPRNQMSPKATPGPNKEKGRRTIWPWQGLRHSQSMLASSAGARSYAAAQGKEKPTKNKALNPEIWVSWSAGHCTADGRKRLLKMSFVGV